MKRRGRKWICICCALLMVMTSGLVAGATDGSEASDWKPMEAEVRVPPDKTWTIQFSRDVDQNSVTPETVYVTDEAGKGFQDLELETDGRKIIVSLKEGQLYEYGESYDLWIKDLSSKADDGEEALLLQQNVQFSFSIVEEDADSEHLEMAKLLNEYQYHNDLVNEYYGDGVDGMSRAELAGNDVAAVNLMAAETFLETQGASLDNIPEEFMEPLASDGSMPAPPGACPAAAEPSVSFKTENGDTVTPGLMEALNLEVIPARKVLAGADDPDSLKAVMQDTVQALMMSDDPQKLQELAMPEGWNTHLWDVLAERREPAASLMDYQLWNMAEDIEEQAAEYLRTALETMPIHEEHQAAVFTAFEQSQNTAWFSKANRPAAPGDAFARMDIVAEMTGNISGTVFEQRAFRIPGAGKPPEFGVQTGEGRVTFQHPKLGKLTFDVDIELDEFDEMGRAIAGKVTAEEQEHGYRSVFEFKDDATKEGNLYLDGELVGRLTMTVNADQFTNFVDLELDKEFDIPPATPTH